MNRNNRMKFFTIVFAFFLFLIPATAKTAGLFESCSTAVCWGDLQCPGFQTFGQSLKKDKICYPEKTYTPCGASGDCSTSKDRVCVVGNAVDKSTGAVAFCIKDTRFPPGDKGDAIFDKCLTSKNCGKNEQCVRITRYDKEFKGLSEFVQNNNCIPLNELPANLIVQDTTGSCGQNQECGADETCIENTYVDIEAKKAYIPLSGLMTFKSPVCYKTKYLNGTCPEYGKSCVVPNGGKNGYCMYALEAGKSALKCVDATYLPNGPQSPSNYACTSDSQCVGAAAEYKYCLTNPVTKQGQCFAQKNIFTDMSKLSAQVCLDGKPCACPLVGKEGCESTGKESICAAYTYKGTSVCIDYTGGGAALSSGKGEATPEPSHLPKADVAQQTYEMYAPKLQIDIPNLTFTDKITAEDGPGGIKRFSIPYLAAYIQAIYKYAIGLGVLIAVVMLMYAGFRWMSSFGNTKAVSEAKTMVGNSMLGLLLVFSAYTILYVINPELPKFKALSILAPKQEVFVGATPGEEVLASTQSSGFANNSGTAGTWTGSGNTTAGSGGGTGDTSGQGKFVWGTLNQKQKKTSVSKIVDCNEKLKLPFNPLATRYDGTTKNPDPNFFTCGLNWTRDIKKITSIIIHEGGSGGDSTANIWISHSKDYVVASHYDITRTGEIIQYVSEAQVANHTNGGGNGAGANNTIGIDLDVVSGCNQVHPTPENYKKCNYTEAQYEALGKLLKDIEQRTGIPHDDDHIVQHCEVCGASHGDIRNLNWSKIGLTYSKHRMPDEACIKRWDLRGACPESGLIKP